MNRGPTIWNDLYNEPFLDGENTQKTRRIAQQDPERWLSFLHSEKFLRFPMKNEHDWSKCPDE